MRQEMPDDVTGSHGGRKARVEDAALRCRHRHRLEAPVIVRYLREDRAFQGVRRVSRGVVQHDVHTSTDLWRASRVVDNDLIVGNHYLASDLDRRVDPIGVDHTLIGSVRNLPNCRPGRIL